MKLQLLLLFACSYDKPWFP